MLCDACNKREATFHTIETINGIRTETHLCSECRRKLMSGDGGMGNLFSQLSSLLTGAPRQSAGAVCPSCGTTEREFLSTGFVGCENCYKTFRRVILPRLARIQAGTVHIGKVPAPEAATPAEEYERLKTELKKAVDAEDYERAASIKNRLCQIRQNEEGKE